MRDEHGVEPRDAGVDQLIAHVGRAIDEHARLAAFDKQRAPPAPVRRSIGIAGAPLPSPIGAADTRNAARRTAAEDCELEAVAHAGRFVLLNSRKKLSVVCSARRAGSTFLSCAT